MIYYRVKFDFVLQGRRLAAFFFVFLFFCRVTVVIFMNFYLHGNTYQGFSKKSENFHGDFFNANTFVFSWFSRFPNRRIYIEYIFGKWDLMKKFDFFFFCFKFFENLLFFRRRSVFFFFFFTLNVLRSFRFFFFYVNNFGKFFVRIFFVCRICKLR